LQFVLHAKVLKRQPVPIKDDLRFDQAPADCTAFLTTLIAIACD
jgi:hypothetical protein